MKYKLKESQSNFTVIVMLQLVWPWYVIIMWCHVPKLWLSSNNLQQRNSMNLGSGFWGCYAILAGKC